MFENKFTPFAWSKIIGNDKVFELVSFPQREMPTWEKYVKGQLELAQTLGWYERNDTKFDKEEFLNKTKRDYDDYIDYLKKLWGRFRVKEKVKILPYHDHIYLMTRYDFDENLLKLVYEIDLGVDVYVKKQHYGMRVAYMLDENYIPSLKNRPRAIHDILPMWLYLEKTAVLARKVGFSCYSCDAGYDFSEEMVRYGFVFDTNRISYDGINLVIDNALFKKL